MCLLTHYGYAQSQKSFNKLIRETNELLIKYEKLSPFSYENFISFKNSGLSKKHINAIISDEDYVDGLSTGRDSICEIDLIMELQGVIIENIYSLVSHDKLVGFVLRLER